jgi:hypothetical protein
MIVALLEQQLGLFCEQGRPSLLERASSPPHPGPEERSPNQVSLRRGTKTCFEGFIGGANFDRTLGSKASSPSPGPEDRSPNQVSLRKGPKTCFDDLIGGATLIKDLFKGFIPKIQVLKIDSQTTSH